MSNEPKLISALVPKDRVRLTPQSEQYKLLFDSNYMTSFVVYLYQSYMVMHVAVARHSYQAPAPFFNPFFDCIAIFKIKRKCK